MPLVTDIIPYVDGDGLVSNNVVPSGVMRGSDNGPLFTSEFLILCALNNEICKSQFAISIKSCLDSDGYLHRSPGDTTQDAPDDYIGVSSYVCFSGDTSVLPKLPLACCQPILLYMQLVARLPIWFPLYAIFSPLAALILAFSNLYEYPTNTSNKLLTWCLIKGLSPKSILCRMAGWFWIWRMNRIYGNTKAIASTYFGTTHPLVTYWVS